TAGGSALCLNGSNLVAFCSSSLRYKKDLSPFTSGLDLVKRLQPITFTWKDSGTRDLGLGAEDVEKIEPLLTTYNSLGEVEVVKYDRIAVVLLNAVTEQQAQIEAQNERIKKLDQRSQRQESVINVLRQLACKNDGTLEICKESAESDNQE